MELETHFDVQTLAKLPVGTRVKITGFSLSAGIYQRILEMGLMVGTECLVERYAPFGDPMEIRVRGYHLSLRSSEAAGIKVEVVGGGNS